MIRSNKTTPAKILSLLVAAALCFTVFTVPVSAEDSAAGSEKKDEKTKTTFIDDVDYDDPEPEVVVPVFNDGRWNRVHSNPATFEKNFKLTPEEKEYSITGYEKVISEILEPDMSDLEKYYTLATWLNHYVDYDWDFWPGGYDFDYYSHQWDAYGILKEKKSVCAGIAVAYANLCHAANLPCKFIRVRPYYLDHTINYIPDINGHAYYIDVTENFFFMSKDANPWRPMDLDFSNISESKIPDDGSFEYSNGSTSNSPSGIKEYYGVPFDKWFKEYALHKNTEYTFETAYVEKGSGTRGTHYAKYEDFDKYPAQTYPSRTSAATGIWFLDDFFTEPATIKNKILHKELDEQLLNISGIKGSYDCTTASDLAKAVSDDIGINYFPSSENGEVFAKTVGLTEAADYTVTCNTFDSSKGEATITVKGAGEYTGECQIPVRINSAAVTQAPANKMDLVYTGEPQALVEPGTAENGTILYAAVSKDGEDESWKEGNPDAAPYPHSYEPPDEAYSEEIPVATDAGRYAVWYKVAGDGTHSDMQPQRLERVAVISPLKPKIIIDNQTIKVGEKIKLSPVLDIEKAVDYYYTSDNDSIAAVSNNGVVKGVAAGTATVIIAGTLTKEEPNYDDPGEIEISVKVNKGENPMKLTARTAKVKRSKLRKKAQTIKRAKIVAVSKAKGKQKYKLVSVKKGKKSFRKYFKVNQKTGNVTVKKGLKKGKYLVKINVKAAGNADYKPSSWKSVTSVVRVK